MQGRSSLPRPPLHRRNRAHRKGESTYRTRQRRAPPHGTLCRGPRRRPIGPPPPAGKARGVPRAERAPFGAFLRLFLLWRLSLPSFFPLSLSFYPFYPFFRSFRLPRSAPRRPPSLRQGQSYPFFRHAPSVSPYLSCPTARRTVSSAPFAAS
ncbi:unknown [Anaerotruncus sp. CAG:390]|nr:unknown [Anaerotruncus sp. CAG:390]